MIEGHLSLQFVSHPQERTREEREKERDVIDGLMTVNLISINSADVGSFF